MTTAITDDDFHNTLELEARRHAAATAVGMLADEMVERERRRLRLPAEALRDSPLLALALGAVGGTPQ